MKRKLFLLLNKIFIKVSPTLFKSQVFWLRTALAAFREVFSYIEDGKN